MYVYVAESILDAARGDDFGYVVVVVPLEEGGLVKDVSRRLRNPRLNPQDPGPFEDFGHAVGMMGGTRGSCPRSESVVAMQTKWR